MSEETPNLKLPYIMPSQAQKHVTHNEAIRALDALVHLAVLERGLENPPGSPLEGARYVVGDAPTAAWSGHAGQVAAFQDGAWGFHEPRLGWLAHVAAENLLVVHNGTIWQEAPIHLAPEDLQNLAGIGLNTSYDGTNRLAVSAPATLLTHEGAGHQVKVNKNAATDTASLLFQTGWSGRAEMGIAGDDDFAIKVSPDGSNWFTGLSVEGASGAVSFAAPVRLPGYTVAEAPSASTAGAGAAIFVTDEAGGAVPAFSDGSQWRRVTDRAIVSV